ncbi:recombinase family protein [Brachybacterium alimentarium]|uniref:recombinase family protein n=1 Tax=Brachybacterium alimentarium TaxID=47845 RepID=UPI000DF4BEF2|nr:recombinase family protein [Brachybacterium alimentarium]RCS79454.1 hypothetical protein CIK67_17865 [Brachybacterium alimentarium]
MIRAVLYLRSATGSGAQTDRQLQDCPEYLRERDLTETGTFTDAGHPGPGFAWLLGQAAAGKVRDVVVADIWRLGRAPVANLRNVDALGQAGVTVHVASGILTGPILDDCGRGSTYAFGIADARRIDGDDEPDRDDPSFD